MKSSTICAKQMRSVADKAPVLVKLDNKEALRDAVSSLMIQMVSNTPQSYGRQRQRKYQPLNVQLEINRTRTNFQFALPTLCQKYWTMRQEIVDRQNCGIQSITSQVLQLIEQLQDQAFCEGLEVDGEGIRSTETVMRAVIMHFLRLKQKAALEGDYQQAKSRLYPKYKKVGFVQPEDGKQLQRCELLIERDSEVSTYGLNRSSMDATEQQEFYRKYLPIPAASQLKQFVTSRNLFEHPDKIEAMRRGKLIAQFCRDEVDYQLQAQRVKMQAVHSKETSLHPSTARLLQEWIDQIDLSQQLFKRKYDWSGQVNQMRKSQALSYDDDQLL